MKRSGIVKAVVLMVVVLFIAGTAMAEEKAAAAPAKDAAAAPAKDAAAAPAKDAAVAPAKDAAAAPAADAAVAPAKDAPADNMQIVKDKISTDKKFLVAANLSLTESEAKAFWPVYDSYQKELLALNERAIKNIGQYADNVGKMNDDLAKKIVTDYLNIEGERQKLRQSYLPKFAKALPYVKVMRYYQIENKIFAVVMYEMAKGIPLVK